MSIRGDDLDGADYNRIRGGSMSVVAPPEDYRWHHSECNFGQGNDIVATAYDVRSQWIAIRLAWLDQFDLEVTIEGAYRYWRWYGMRSGQRICYWWERRPMDAPLPSTPGLWPSDA